MADYAIDVKGLDKSFGNVKALAGLDLQVAKGSVHGFLGPNGAGKSTTIRVLLGLLKKDSGEVSVLGSDPWHDSVDLHKRIAYIPGDVSLWPSLTGGEIIDILTAVAGGGIDKNKKARKKELIELFSLDPTKKFHTYSKGNRQKVAIIAALARDVDLYLFDEPTSGLDPLLERRFQQYLLENVLSQNNVEKTILLSSHILSEVDKLCDHVTIIKEGHAVLSGSLRELRELTHTTIKVSFHEDSDTEKASAELKKIEGIEIEDSLMGSATDELSARIESGKLDQVVKLLAKYKLKTLNSASATLEELFMTHYQDV